MNQLFYGDNLHVLRGQIADGAVDLIYLDPPFTRSGITICSSGTQTDGFVLSAILTITNCSRDYVTN